MGEKVSVIVPVYNAGDDLRTAIESIQKQSYENLEIIIVNDGSTDGSLELAEELKAEDVRIRVFTQENAGVSAARNKGLSEALGEFVLFVDADDSIDADMVDSLLNAIEDSKADVACCHLYEEKEQSRRQTVYEGKEAAGLALLKVWAIYCKLYRRALLQDIRFEDHKVAEDVLFNACVIADTNFNKVVEVDFAPYHYRIHEGSVMTGTFDRKFMDAMYVEASCYQKLKKVSPAFTDINLVGCSVSRVFEKYAALPVEEQEKWKDAYRECKDFAKAHKRELLQTKDRHRKVSGMLKVYVPDLYLKSLEKRYRA